jgi:hypothetical protein
LQGLASGAIAGAMGGLSKAYDVFDVGKLGGKSSINSLMKSVSNLASKAGLSDFLMKSDRGLFSRFKEEWFELGKAAIGEIYSELANSPSQPESRTKYSGGTMQGDEPKLFIQKPGESSSFDRSGQKGSEGSKKSNKNGLLNEAERPYAAAITYMSFFGKQSAF